MFTDDKPEIERLERKLVDIVNDETEPCGFDDALTALVRAFTFQMALACPGCRKDIARALRKGVPDMLATANRISAEAGPREQKHLQ